MPEVKSESPVGSWMGEVQGPLMPGTLWPGVHPVGEMFGSKGATSADLMISSFY